MAGACPRKNTEMLIVCLLAWLVALLVVVAAVG